MAREDWNNAGGIDPTARISPDAVIGEGVQIGPGAVIHGPVQIGNRVIIGANTVIGGPGFAFDREARPPVREDFTGTVVIGDDVEIGNCSNIDRGRKVTTIHWGTKVDSCCHIAHDCSVGPCAILAAGTILGGHAIVGDSARIGLNATLRNRSEVESGAIVGMHTPVLRRVAANTKKTVMGK